MEYTYTLKDGVNVEDPKKSVVVLHNFTPEFTLHDLENNIEVNEKQKKEATSNRDYLEKKMANIEEHHPFVKEMTELDLFTAHMYQEAVMKKKQFNDLLAKLDEQLESDKKEVTDIYAQLPELVQVANTTE